MTDLSPTARAILNAYRDLSWRPDEEDPNKYYKFSHMTGIAAVLRVAAERIACWGSADQLLEIAEELEQRS